MFMHILYAYSRCFARKKIDIGLKVAMFFQIIQSERGWQNEKDTMLGSDHNPVLYTPIRLYNPRNGTMECNLKITNM